MCSRIRRTRTDEPSGQSVSHLRAEIAVEPKSHDTSGSKVSAIASAYQRSRNNQASVAVVSASLLRFNHEEERGRAAGHRRSVWRTRLCATTALALQTVSQPAGSRSVVSLCARSGPNQRLAATTRLPAFLFRYANHQPKVELAMMAC